MMLVSRCSPHRTVLLSFLIAPRHQARSYSFNSYLVTPNELYSALQKNAPTRLSTSPRVIPLCAAWFMPNDPQARTGLGSYKAAHIPGARFFDVDAINDPDSPYPHMLPSAEDFSTAMGNLGINRDDTVVVYDTQELGIFSAPRVAWTLQVFNHPQVHILNNFLLWVKQGLPVESGYPKRPEPVKYIIPDQNAERVATFEEVKEIALDRSKEGSEGAQVLDARSRGRWEGSEEEPRPGTVHAINSFALTLIFI
jgi:thiosulfate/3-mercaptopyruvate sulfurtransferase